MDRYRQTNIDRQTDRQAVRQTNNSIHADRQICIGKQADIDVKIYYTRCIIYTIYWIQYRHSRYRKTGRYTVDVQICICINIIHYTV